MGDIEWTEAHKREALARTHELIAELVREGRDDDARAMRFDVESYARSEAMFRENLEWFDGARREREVRRVDALATGRIVRETAYFVRDSLGTLRRDFPRTREGFKAARVFIADHLREYPNGRMAMRVVCVTGLRRAT